MASPIRLCRRDQGPDRPRTCAATTRSGRAAAYRELFLASRAAARRGKLFGDRPPARAPLSPGRSRTPACRSTPSMSAAWMPPHWSISAAPGRALCLLGAPTCRARRRRRARPLAAPDRVRPRPLAPPRHPPPRPQGRVEGRRRRRHRLRRHARTAAAQAGLRPADPPRRRSRRVRDARFAAAVARCSAQPSRQEVSVERVEPEGGGHRPTKARELPLEGAGST